MRIQAGYTLYRFLFPSPSSSSRMAANGNSWEITEFCLKRSKCTRRIENNVLRLCSAVLEYKKPGAAHRQSNSVLHAFRLYWTYATSLRCKDNPTHRCGHTARAYFSSNFYGRQWMWMRRSHLWSRRFWCVVRLLGPNGSFEGSWR